MCARTVDANGGVVLDSEINVLLNTETEVAGVAEVVAVELVLLDLVCEASVRKRSHGIDLISECTCEINKDTRHH